jgi:hypothetical protein
MIERQRTRNTKMTFDQFRECSIDVMESINVADLYWKSTHSDKAKAKRLDEIDSKRAC